MAYKFDAKNEPATVKIRLLPKCYVRIDDGTGDPETKTRKGKDYYPTKRAELALEGNKAVTRVDWDFDTADVWVPERIAKELTEQTDNGKDNPIAKIIETRSVDEAMGREPVEVVETGAIEAPADVD